MTDSAKKTKTEALVPHAPVVRRSVMGALAFAMIDNQDPDKHYVVVNRADSRARAEYEARGYTIERYREGGCRPRGLAVENIRMGEPVEALEGFVMSVSKETLAEVDAAGRQVMEDIARRMASSRQNALGQMPPSARQYFRESNYTAEEGSGMEHGEMV